MMLQKLIASRISEFNKPNFKDCFNKILKDLSEGILIGTDPRKKNKFYGDLDEDRNSNFYWNILIKEMEENHEKYQLSNIIIKYLVIKAKKKIEEIKKFSKELGIDSQEIVNIVCFYKN
jgi:hypothetical protein